MRKTKVTIVINNWFRNLIMKRRNFRILSCFFIIAIYGCASHWSKHNVFFEAPQKLKVIVLPVECEVRVKKLKLIKSTKDDVLPTDAEEKIIKDEIARVAEEISKNIEVRLNNSYFFESVPLEKTRLAMNTIGIKGLELSDKQLKELGEVLNAKLILRTYLSGYGTIKKKWQVLLLGSGLLEGVTQGIIAYKLSHSKSLSILIATEEFAQEALVWGGGIYIFNHIFSPVILESELISVSDQRIIWSKTAFSTIDRKAIKKYTSEEQKLKELRLKVTAEKAVNEIIKSIQEAALKNLD